MCLSYCCLLCANPVLCQHTTHSPQPSLYLQFKSGQFVKYTFYAVFCYCLSSLSQLPLHHSIVPFPPPLSPFHPYRLSCRVARVLLSLPLSINLSSSQSHQPCKVRYCGTVLPTLYPLPPTRWLIFKCPLTLCRHRVS